MKFRNLFVITLALFIVTACGSKKDQLVGKWNVSDMKVPGLNVEEFSEEAKAEYEAQFEKVKQESNFEFKKDGTFSFVLAGEEKTGTWELNEEATTLTTKSEEGEEATFDLTEFAKDKIVMTMKTEGETLFTLTIVPAE